MAENNIKKLTDYNHLRTRIPMYLGGTDPHTQSILEVIDGIPEVVEETWVPALYTGFREILDNASDEVVGHGHGSKIDVNYDQDKMIFSVQDDGRGIPFDYSEEYGCHLATMVLSEPRTGRNFDERKKVAGTNGIGSSATSNTSEWFKFKIIKNGKVFSQEFNEGDKDATSLVIKDPIIKDTTNKASGSFIEYHPSPNVYKHMILPECFLKSRIFEFAACNPNIKVSYNGSLIKVKPKIEQTLFTGRKTIVIDIEDTESDFTSKFIVVPNFIKDGEHYHSIVNNIPAINGGSHMDAFRLSFFKNLINALERESKKRKLFPNRSDVTEGLLIYNVTKMDSPDFDSQSKTRLTNEEAGKIINKFLNDDEFYKNIIKKNKEWIDEIYQRCADRTKKKDASELNKLQKKIGKVKVASLMDATGKDRSKCTLLLGEGQSAIGTGKSARTPEIHGVMPLRGKLLNVNGTPLTECASNKVLQDIMNAIGLVIGKKAIRKDLRYNKVWIATDEDYDGAAICALIVNFFYTFWPELLEDKDNPFLYRFQTPFIIADKGKDRKYWDSSNYNEFIPSEWKGWNITRAKGLAALTEEDWKECYKNPKLIPIVEDENLKESLDMIFNGSRADDRKEWMSI